MNKKKREQEQKQIVEYLLECSLRYGSPLVIAAIRGKKRVSRHVVSRFLRRSDIVVRTTADYLLALMPFTTLEQASIPLKRLTSRLPLKEVVLADVNMLQALLGTQGSYGNSEANVTASRELRRMCFQAFDGRFASIKSSEEKSGVPAIYNLFEPGSSQALTSWLEAAFSDSKSAANTLSRAEDESAAMASL